MGFWVLDEIDDDWESPLVKSNHTLDRGNNKR